MILNNAFQRNNKPPCFEPNRSTGSIPSQGEPRRYLRLKATTTPIAGSEVRIATFMTLQLIIRIMEPE